MALEEEGDLSAVVPGEEEADIALSDDGEDASDPELESDGQEQIMRRSLEPRISSGSERRSIDSGCAAPEETDTTEEAGQVFVMMEETFRVSRNTRAQWFLQYLNKAVVWNPEVKSNAEEREPLEIISCIPREPSTLAEGECATSFPKKMYRITQNTEVTFLSKCYRLVFALDLTPSMAAVSLTNGNVAVAQLFLALRECLTAISQPSLIPGTTTSFAPKVFITVFVHAPFLTSKSVPVIAKGFRLLPETLPDLLTIIHDELVHLENDVIPRLNAEVRKYSCAGQGNPSLSKPFLTMDMALANILRKGLLSVQLLPDNSCGHIIVVTDGILDFPDVGLMDSLLSQLRSHTISVSFIRVACSDGDSFAGSDFGYICNVDLMEFIAKTTSGAYVEYKPWDCAVQSDRTCADCPVSAAAGGGAVALSNLGELNGTDASVYRKAFFTCNFQQRNDFIAGATKRPDNLRLVDATASRSMKRFISHSVLEVSIGGLLSIRLREGFTVKSVNFSKNGSVVDLVLVMPWKPEINLEYRICAVWPPTENTQITAEVHVEAPYEFLYDWIYMNSQKIPYGKHRLATLRQFKTTVLGLESADQFLLHIEQFRSDVANYTLPEVIKDKMPVFYFPPDDMENPIFSTNELDDFLDFTSFWRPICVMDVNSWHQWLHVHRISILLEHDKPLLNNIFNQRRSATVRCSVAMNQLHDLLRRWSTIVLVDGHSYVRFLYDEEEGPAAPPKSFFVIRMAAKPPCVVLRLAFLGGTPGAVRHRIITELDKMVSALTMQVKSLPNVEPTCVLCCWKFVKPVEKMLIQYKDIPNDMFNTALSPSIVHDKATQTQFPVANPGAFQALSRFLYCRRYVWMPLKQSTPILYFDAIGRIVTVLVSLRLREGFRFSSTSGGVFNLTTEIQMTDLVAETVKTASDSVRDFPPCVVQFIVFPPKGVRDSMGEELLDSEMKLEKYSIAVEIWVEPQYGLCRTAGMPCAYLNNLMYKQVPEKMHELDSDLLSTFLTFEILFALCSPASCRRPWSYNNPSFSRSVSRDPAKHRTDLEDNADMLNFPFDVARLITKCHRTRMLFPSFRQSDQAKDVTASNAFLFRFFTSEIKRLHAREISLTPSECERIFEVLKEGLTSTQLESLTGSVVGENETDGEAGRQANQAYSHIPEWRLFVKRISEVLLVLTLIPSSYSALQKITQVLDIDLIDTDVTQTQAVNLTAVGQSDSSTIFSYGEGDSETDETATLKRPVALAVPVYIFSCTFDGLQAHLVDKKSVSRSHNFDFDLTASFNVQYDRLAKRISESRTDDFSDRGSLRSSSFPIKNSRDHTKLYLMFPTIEDAFAKAFVQGVYKSLHFGINVDPHDIQAADGLCDEVPVEIDLTAFIRAVCSHFRRDDHHSSKIRRSPKKLTQASRDDFRLQSPHLDIKQQFQSIVSTCLQRVENKPDLFFYCLPGNLGRSRRSMSDLDLDDSEISESSVEFRLETSTPLRESVSGLSEAESSPGFFQREVNSISLDSDVESCTSVFGSVIEGESAGTDGKEEDEEEEESDDEALTPLFVQFVCAVFATTSKKELGSCPVRQLPTCFEDILKCIEGAAEAARSLDYADIRLRLDVLCLTLPDDLKTISSVEGRPSMRTISGSSINRDMRESDSDISAINEEASARSETEELNQLPPQQAEKMKVVVDKIKWHLQDEIAHVLSSAEELPTAENLTLVVDHVRNSRARQTSVEYHVPLKFVYNVDQSFGMFIQRFEKSTVPGYRFVKQDQYYYLATYLGSPVLRRRAKLLNVPSTATDRLRSPSFDTGAIQSKTSKLNRLAELKTPRRASLPVFMINKEPHGIVNPVNNADIRAFRRMPAIQDSLTDDEVCMFEASEGDEMKSSVEKSDHEYDAGSSESEDEQEEEAVELEEPVEQSQQERDRAKTELPGFWLILKFKPDEASVFFHVHESEIDSATMSKHQELIEVTLRKIKASAKLVNQELLLKNLLETRRCENLLEPETHEDIWKGPAVQEVFAKGVPADGEDDQPGSGTERSYLEASRHFQPGYFKCDMVFEHDFHVHPRLKMGPGKGGMSRASQALLGLLSTFKVNNRQNMFVVQDNANEAEAGAVFYMRLFDKTQCRRFTSSSFDGECSRTSSIARREPYLGRAVTLDAELAKLSESPKGDSDSKSPISTDSFILSFYGTCPVSDKTAWELISALQNRLDEAVLDTLNIILSRNVMLKLGGEDVRFIQPFQAPPSETLRISIPGVISKNEISLFKVFHYVLQDLSVFLHCPKYVDGETDKHFHQLDPMDDTWRPADDGSSFLYNRPSESGGRGIAFISVGQIFFAMDTEPMGRQHGSWSEKLDLVGKVTELTKEEVVEADGDLILQVWEKGNVDRPALIEKLRHAVRHALLDFWMEEHVLPMLKNMPTSLPPSSCNLLQAYLNCCVDCKSPAYQASTFNLPSRRVVDILADSVVSIVNSPHNSLSLSALVGKVDGDVEKDSVETRLDGSQATIKDMLIPLVRDLRPGQFVSCRVLGLATEEAEVIVRIPRSVSAEAASNDEKLKQRTSKKFMTRFDHTGAVAVPRGKLLYITIHDTTCQLFLYNFSTDLATLFDKSINRLFEWHHERQRFLNNIVLQKCGVFTPMAVFDSRPSPDMPSFVTNPLQADTLIAYTNAPPREGSRNYQNPKYQHGSLPQFGLTMENSFPSRFFADEQNRNTVDPVVYHGKQFQEIRQRKKRSNDIRYRLNTLYGLWRQRDRRRPIREDILQLLKNNSRPAHFCASPLLFDPYWRKNLGARFPDRQLLCYSPVPKGLAHDSSGMDVDASTRYDRVDGQVVSTGNRSRNSSGVPSISSKDKNRPNSTPNFVGETQRRVSGPSVDQQWHTQVKNILMQEYVHYLQMQGFSVVFARPPSPQRHVKKSPQNNTRATSGTSSPTPPHNTSPQSVALGGPAAAPRFTPSCTYLQRCVPGGMIFLELFFMAPFFFSRMYAVDLHKFSDDFSAVGGDPHKALMNLQREIDRLKVAMHMHSFLYDFHLNCITKYIAGKSPFFKQGYHFVSFFDDFANYYQKPPSYSKGSFQSGSLVVPCGSIAPNKLYDYILKRDKQYGLSSIRMAAVLPEEDTGTEFALVCTGLSSKVREQVDCSFIIYADTTDEIPTVARNSNLVLRYYIILTSIDDAYSTDFLEERFGSFKPLPPPKRARPAVPPETVTVPVSLHTPLMITTALLFPDDPPKESPQIEPEEAKVEGDKVEGGEAAEEKVSLPKSGGTSSDNLVGKASLVAAFPNFLYIGYFSRLETELKRIVDQQKTVLESFVVSIVQDAIRDWVRDTLWSRLIETNETENERRRMETGRHREESGTTFGRRAPSEAYRFAPKIQFNEFEDLVKHVYCVPVVELDPQLSIFFQANAFWLDGLLETLRAKYWDIQRPFISQQSLPQVTQHLVILCPNLPEITLYLKYKTGSSVIDADILSKNPIDLMELRQNEAFVTFMQGFVNACGFHMWKTVLPP
ncbi:hypothetical protein RvY_13293-2 [Ramazzottius varieornatus]|uniref:Uncharacterized protein n=1 Tax=Ramazzottius varieornatus TaxID=947166 RepID=A0A1D1VSQ5_RAMVA|nr:hypothetical protein RvY_13293-2 [Ramazzottius varieornatus]